MYNMETITSERMIRTEVMRLMAPIVMLVGSNLFMTYAWYGHLKDLKGKAVLIAIVASWAVAFFEYCLQVPANRIGFQFFSLAQLKVIQEIITMTVFAVFCVVYMKHTARSSISSGRVYVCSPPRILCSGASRCRAKG